MPHSRLHKLHAAGQSVWLDYIDRTILADGALTRQIDDDALTGMTSNPTIFEKALATGTAYDAQLASAADGLTPWQLFELVESDDVRTACDQFRAVYEQSGGTDGYVSIEVSPNVANDADARFGIQSGDIASDEITVVGEVLRGLLRHAPITLEHIGALDFEPARLLA